LVVDVTAASAIHAVWISLSSPDVWDWMTCAQFWLQTSEDGMLKQLIVDIFDPLGYSGETRDEVRGHLINALWVSESC